MEYNEEINQYYITEDDVIAYFDIDKADLSRVFKNINKSLKVLSRAVYRAIYNEYEGPNKKAHEQFMRAKIAKNMDNERMYLKHAMLEMAYGAYESGMDLNPYIKEAQTNIPFTVMQELDSGKLLIPGEKHEV